MGGEDDIIRKGKVTSLLYMHYTKLIRRIIDLKKIWVCMLCSYIFLKMTLNLKTIFNYSFLNAREADSTFHTCI